MQPADWSVVDTDDEPWELDDGAESRRLSLRVLVLCGAIGAAIAFAAWWTTR